MKHLKFLIVFVVVAVVLFSCKKESTSTGNMGYNYFPITAGMYVEYDVDSTFYDDFFVPSKAITTKFRLKEKIKSLFYDDENRLTARLERYVKYYDTAVPYADMEWKLKDVWVENVLKTTAERVEENVRYVRLLFPVQIHRTWNGNAKNSIKQRDFSYTAVDVTDNVGNVPFDSVLQTKYDDGGTILTSRVYYTEKYARNVGLIYKKEINIESQPSTESTQAELQTFYSKPILERITSGYEYTWTIHAFGEEK